MPFQIIDDIDEIPDEQSYFEDEEIEQVETTTILIEEEADHSGAPANRPGSEINRCNMEKKITTRSAALCVHQ